MASQGPGTAFGVDKHTGWPLFPASERPFVREIYTHLLAGSYCCASHSVYLLRVLAHLESLWEGLLDVSPEVPLKSLRGSHIWHTELPGLLSGGNMVMSPGTVRRIRVSSGTCYYQ